MKTLLIGLLALFLASGAWAAPRCQKVDLLFSHGETTSTCVYRGGANAIAAIQPHLFGQIARMDVEVPTLAAATTATIRVRKMPETLILSTSACVESTTTTVTHSWPGVPWCGLGDVTGVLDTASSGTTRVKVWLFYLE